MNWLKGPFVDVRSGEWRLTILMASYYFSLLLFYYLLKPARDSLFLINIDPSHLPFVYILTALVAAPVTAAYARAGLKYRLDRLTLVTTAILLVHLVLMWWLLSIRQDWVFYVFYAWVGVAAGLTTSQFWLVANTVFDAVEAKRIFPILGLGGIAGAFFGGELTSFLVDTLQLGTRDLLLVGLVFLFLAGMISRTVWREKVTSLNRITDDEAYVGSNEKSWTVLPQVLRSRHLMLTVGIISLTVITGSFIDFQFKTLSWAAFSDSGDLTSFLGRFYGRMSLLSFVVQGLLATRLIRWLGAGSVLFVLPMVLALGAGMMFVIPGLMAAMVMRGGEISLKYSLDKTSRELLFLPVPFALKKRTKVFLDMLVDRWARGIAGVMLLLCTAGLGFDQQSLAMVTAILLIIWLVLAFFMRREYVNSFRKALTRGEIDVRQMRVRIDDSASLGILLGALKSNQQRELNYALDMLKGVKSSRLAEGVRPLLENKSAEIRRKVLDLLKINGSVEDLDAVEKFLQDDDLGVRLSTLGVLDELGSIKGRPGEFLGEMISGPSLCRNAAMAFIAANPQRLELRPLVNRLVVDQVLADVSVWGVEGRRVLGGLPWLPAGCTPRLWDKLLEEQEMSVVEATVLGMGHRHDLDRVDWLLTNLDHPHLRICARLALVSLVQAQENLIDRLEEFFLSSENSLRARTEIPRVLSRISSKVAVNVLLRRLATHEPELRYIVLKALGRQHSLYPDLKFDSKIVSEEITVEASRFLQLARLANFLTDGGAPVRLIRHAIDETQQLRLESVFRLLGLLYPARDVHNAYNGIMSGRRVANANAREFLANFLARPHNELVQMLIDDREVGDVWSSAGVDPGPSLNTTEEVLNFLGISCDPWLASCAVFAGAEVENPAVKPYLEPIGAEMLSIVEKVLLLQKLNVFSEIPTDQMAALAAIAREISVLGGDEIYQENDRPDALYLVLQGEIILQQGDEQLSEAGPMDSFGVWALFDEAPRTMTAVAREDSNLLRIDSGEFNDLLADDIRITKGIIRTMTRRLRELSD